MRLAIGQPAPSFRATTWDGKPVSLADYQGQKLWLAFFRYASCPLCNVRVRAIYRRVDELTKSGVAVVAVFQSPGHKVREYVLEGDEPPMPIIADPEMTLYEQYALERSVLGFLQPRNLGGDVGSTFSRNRLQLKRSTPYVTTRPTGPWQSRIMGFQGSVTRKATTKASQKKHQVQRNRCTNPHGSSCVMTVRGSGGGAGRAGSR